MKQIMKVGEQLINSEQLPSESQSAIRVSFYISNFINPNYQTKLIKQTKNMKYLHQKSITLVFKLK